MEDEQNWSEKLEDILESGDSDSAISFLETIISDLQTPISSNSESQLASVLLELADLYASKGLSLKADEARSRSSAIRLRKLEAGKEESEELRAPDAGDVRQISSTRIGHANAGESELCVESTKDDSRTGGPSDDDWETMADRAPDELLTPQSLPGISKLSLAETDTTVTKRRGRGTFSYRKHGLYSDQQSDEARVHEPNDNFVQESKNSEMRNCIYGTRHVLVLDGFQPSTTTTDLEKLFQNFKERGFSIRWVNDTLALAVFRSPSLAREACDRVRSSFSMRVLEEDDVIMSSISTRDLDPPRQRPQTSAQTAKRLIAQGMGLKIPTSFGSRELQKQEEARKNRIVTRQHLRDDAWGPDDVDAK